MDQPKIERLLRLMKYLSSNSSNSIGSLGKKLGMSPRTIYRYIDTLKSAGFSVSKLYGDVYRLTSMPDSSVDIEKLVYFSEEEAYLVNGLIDRIEASSSLKAGLKAKLSAIYDSTSIADYVSKGTNIARVEALGEAIKGRRKVILKNYQSGHSQTVRDRYIEPYGFTTGHVDVCAFDLEDSRNKIFKISRIEEVVVLEDEPWTESSQHHSRGIDIFRFSGDEPVRVVLNLSVKAKNLLVEEYPLARKDLRSEGQRWILDTQVYDFKGICRFYAGLATEIEIVSPIEFKRFAREYLSEALEKC